jgi:hypothetical protein
MVLSNDAFQIVTEQSLRPYKMIGTREYYLIMSTVMQITRFEKYCIKFCVRLRLLVS